MATGGQDRHELRCRLREGHGASCSRENPVTTVCSRNPCDARPTVGANPKLMVMLIHIATDHAGLELSADLQAHLRAAGHDVVDHGPQTYEPLDDYPSFCINAALAVARDQAAGIECLGIVFGGSGNGEQIAANKVKGIRAALVWNDSTALLARQHTDEEAKRFIDLFIAEPFSGEERHARRIAQIAEFEATGSIAGHTDA